MFNWFRQKQVVLYSVDTYTDAAVMAALKMTKRVRVRQVFTLDPIKVTGFMLFKDNVPRHIKESRLVLRRDLPGKEPYTFITVLPRGERVNAWLTSEFKAATGVDLLAEPFDYSQPVKRIQMGIHQLLVVSAEVPFAEQVAAIGTYLDRRVARLPTPKRRRIAGTLARLGQIKAPLDLVSNMDSPDIGGERLREKLQGQAVFFDDPFPFTPMQPRAYEPSPNTVLYYAHQSLPYHTSGYATRTQGIAKAITNQGWNLIVATRAGYPADTRKAPPEHALEDIDGVPYVRDLMPGRGQSDLTLDKHLESATQYLCEQASILKPAIIHSASNYISGVVGVEAARRMGVPSIYEMRGLWHVTRWSKEPEYGDTDKFALAQKLELDAARNATKVIAITGALKEWLIDRGIDGDKISLAPNAVDLSKFSPTPRDDAFAAENGCEGKVVIGYIGSFVAYEGLEVLLDAVALLPKDLRSQVQLLWLGDGPVLNDLLARASRLRIRRRISALGRRPYDDVPRAYSIVDICAFPRKGVPVCEIVSPLKPFEAMACAKAIVVSDVRPLREIVQDGVTGLVHVKDDAASLSAALARFIVDPELRKACGQGAREWVASTRTWETIAQNITHVYKTLA